MVMKENICSGAVGFKKLLLAVFKAWAVNYITLLVILYEVIQNINTLLTVIKYSCVIFIIL
jgi:hypothetical protein